MFFGTHSFSFFTPCRILCVKYSFRVIDIVSWEMCLYGAHTIFSYVMRSPSSYQAKLNITVDQPCEPIVPLWSSVPCSHEYPLLKSSSQKTIFSYSLFYKLFYGRHGQWFEKKKLRWHPINNNFLDSVGTGLTFIPIIRLIRNWNIIKVPKYTNEKLQQW